MGRLDGKVAIVTGGGSGIGRATVQVLAREGASVIVTDLDTEAGQAVVAEVGPAARFVSQDVAAEDGWPPVIEAAGEAFGGLDILVNNAGLALEGTVESTSLEIWQRVFAVNAQGIFLGCRAIIPVLRERGGGVIINIASRAALGGAPPQLAAYGASKGAVRQYTKTLATHCGFNGDNIRCNSINPGAIDTPLFRASVNDTPDPEICLEKMAAKAPLGRIGAPEDIAHAVLYLASDEAAFVTGIELTVDGGVSAT
ncbi:MAG TPA: glucose 1-dehydrogenase [Alphaproteobacteria bacterium]|nr:glucose 1-dehydrogenase [Alphaproteobacteria bacterium]